MTVIVTIPQLQSAGACQSALREFRRQYGGDRAEIDWSEAGQQALLASPLGRYTGWACKHGLLPPLTVGDPVENWLLFAGLKDAAGRVQEPYRRLAVHLRKRAQRIARGESLPKKIGRCCPEKTLPEGLTLALPDLAGRVLTPLAVARLDEANLQPGVPGERFNAAALRWRGRELLAWRRQRVGSAILLTDLGSGQTWPLDLAHVKAQRGREDPRLFEFQGRLHVAFTAIGAANEISVAYAPIIEDGAGFRAGRVFLPDLPDRGRHEKNWGFFAARPGALHAVYSLDPLRILRIDGSNADEAFRASWRSPWQGGEMRGGASPVRVGDEWVVWFHGVRWADRLYTAGVLTFAAAPPFTPLRCTRWPLIVPTAAGRPASEKNLAWYVCGAYLDGDEWVVSGGVHNAWIEVRRYRAADVDAQLERIES